jgi:predicted RNase H-like HicB family nuclease
METKKAKALIGRSKTGYTIMMEGFDLAMSYGDTLEEAKRDFESFPQEYIEISREAGKAIPPELNNGNLEFEYIYDLSGFFTYKRARELHSIGKELMEVAFEPA